MWRNKNWFSVFSPLFPTRARRTGFWRYSIIGNRILFQSLLDLKSDPTGKIYLSGGKAITRVFQVGPGFLRLFRQRGAYLDFVKID